MDRALERRKGVPRPLPCLLRPPPRRRRWRRQKARQPHREGATLPGTRLRQRPVHLPPPGALRVPVRADRRAGLGRGRLREAVRRRRRGGLRAGPALRDVVAEHGRCELSVVVLYLLFCLVPREIATGVRHRRIMLDTWYHSEPWGFCSRHLLIITHRSRARPSARPRTHPFLRCGLAHASQRGTQPRSETAA